MTKNVGRADRAVRLVLGIVLLSIFFLASGGLHWIGLVGVVPLMTGLMQWCPVYRLFGISTYEGAADKAAV